MKGKTVIGFRWLLLVGLIVAGCGAAPGGVVGTWELDNAAMTTAFQRQLEAAGAALPAIAREAMAEALGEMDWTVTLHENGSAALEMREDGSIFESSGAWVLDGSTVTIEYDDRRDRTVVMTGALAEGRITLLAPDGDGPPIILKRSRRAALAMEELPPVPALGPLRSACPPTLKAPERGDGPVDDILQLRPGMSYDDVIALLECRDDIRLVQTAPLFSIADNFGIPTRQLIRASDGIPCTEREARGERCSSLGRFDPLRDITREYIVAFTGMPGQEVARAVWRRTLYMEDEAPAVSLTIESLVQKYGEPQIQATGSHPRISEARAGATDLVWIHARDGSPLPSPQAHFSSAAINWEVCINGPKPWFSARHSWNAGCHLTVRAEILPQPGNGLRARELNMVVMNQRDFYHGGEQFQAALRTVSDQQLRERSERPDL